jgi:hypothetical protein
MMAFAYGTKIKELAIMKLVFLLVSALQQELTAAAPPSDPYYAEIWAREDPAQIKAAALTCYANVISIPGRIENATKHTLKHMRFPDVHRRTVSRQLIVG